MKKFSTILVFILLAALLAGCAGNEISEVSAGDAAGDGSLGEATTKILDKTPSRVHNIELAMDKVDGHTLAPGEEFSFNGVVGERSEGAGYEEAIALINTDKVMETGGGVCQLSTTIYQAAKDAGMKITERHRHKKKIAYAAAGEDATVDYATKTDLKFVNDTEDPVKISCSIKENRLTVTIG